MTTNTLHTRNKYISHCCSIANNTANTLYSVNCRHCSITQHYLMQLLCILNYL